MKLNLIVDDSVPLNGSKSKKLRKQVIRNLEGKVDQWDKIDVYLENFGLYSTCIKAYSESEFLSCEVDDSCMNRSVLNCINNFTSKCQSLGYINQDLNVVG